MKTIILILFLACTLPFYGQAGRKDTVRLDSTQVEKIRKMPMDTALHNMPVVPPKPPKNKKDTTSRTRREVPQKKQPV